MIDNQREMIIFVENKQKGIMTNEIRLGEYNLCV